MWSTYAILPEDHLLRYRIILRKTQNRHPPRQPDKSICGFPVREDLSPMADRRSMSPLLMKITGSSKVDSDEKPRKRSLADDNQPKKSVRRRVACQSCRVRKVKCDNARPTCAICANSGSECVYLEAPSVTVIDPTTRLMLDRLDQILAGVNGIGSTMSYRSWSNHSEVRTEIHRSPDNSPRTFQTSCTYDSMGLAGPTDPSNEGFRDYLKILSCKTTADGALTWPIFGGKFTQDSLIRTIFNPDEPKDGALSSGSADALQVPGGLLSLPDERIPILIERFLDCVHTKNPILDVESLLQHGKKAAENGLGWDAHSCLILLACALGCIAYPFDLNSESAHRPSSEAEVLSLSSSSSLFFARELKLAESCYVLACRRLGLLKYTVLGAQCHFFAGVFLMYTFRTLPAWNHFCQASTFYQVHSRTVAGPDRPASINSPLSGMSTTQRRLEQSLYWSCFKSECEIRVELPLPQSSIADFEYPHMFPSPPSPPSNFAPEISATPAYNRNATSPTEIITSSAKRWNEELSWYYYLTEVALRRIGNRIINTFYRKDHISWLDINPLIPMAEEFEAQISSWSTNLPVVMQYESGHVDGRPSPSKELGWATANRLLEMKSWLYMPFIYYAIHSPAPTLDAPENATLRRFVDAAMECNHNIVQNRSVRHRHHGIWFDIRALVTAAVVLSAVIKSGTMGVPAQWDVLFTTVIKTLRFWEDESPDLHKTRIVVEGLFAESKKSMGVN